MSGFILCNVIAKAKPEAIRMEGLEYYIKHNSYYIDSIFSENGGSSPP
jgi:hypothetical protein